MEMFRAAEALLRSSQPLLTFLAPAAVRRLPQPVAAAAASPISRHCRAQRTQSAASRAFSTAVCRHQQAAAAAQEIEHPSPSSDFPSTSPRSQSTVDADIASLIDGPPKSNRGSSTAATTGLSSFPQKNYTPLDAAPKRSTGSSVTDLLDTMTRLLPKREKRNRVKEIFGDVGGPDARKPPDEYLEEAPVMKFGPAIGRTVRVDNRRNMDVGKAFTRLEQLCARNTIRRDFTAQRFHERPGLKRKRLKRERWRKNFKVQFQATVALVQRMRRQGW